MALVWKSWWESVWERKDGLELIDRQLARLAIIAEDAVRASGGNRTHNPRITNAVLCQLKLRWPDGAGGTRETRKSSLLELRTVAHRAHYSQGSTAKNPGRSSERQFKKEKSGASDPTGAPCLGRTGQGRLTVRPDVVGGPTSKCGGAGTSVPGDLRQLHTACQNRFSAGIPVPKSIL